MVWLKWAIVRLTVGMLAILGIKVSAIYFLPAVLLLGTHNREFFGW